MYIYILLLFNLGLYGMINFTYKLMNINKWYFQI